MKNKKFVVALAMLLVSAISLSTASFAWFSLNNKVTVTGMTVKTSVSSNLFIAPSSAGTGKALESAFTSALHQSVGSDKNIQPSSTIDGLNYYYTYDAKDDGSKLTNASYKYQKVAENKINTSDTADTAYVDQVFEIKATNTGNAIKYVNLTKLNLLYKGAVATDKDKAYRVAVFVQELDTASAYEAISDESADSIFRMDGALYFTTGKAVAITTACADADGGHAATADNHASHVCTEAYGVKTIPTTVLDQPISLAVAANDTQYFKITVRLWLEGEDTTCKPSTYVDLTDAWDLDMAFSFDTDDDDAVTNIGSAVNATIADAGTKLTAELKNGETAFSYHWVKKNKATAFTFGGDTSNGEITVTTTDLAANGIYYCEITTTKGNVYRTNDLIVNNAFNLTFDGKTSTVSVPAVDGATYRWYKGTTAVSGSGSTTANYTLTTAAENGDYHCVITYEGIEYTSNTLAAALYAAQYDSVNNKVSLNVSFSGTPTYQWYDNDAEVSGDAGKGAVLHVAGRDTTADHEYKCVVTVGSTGYTSAACVVAATPAP